MERVAHNPRRIAALAAALLFLTLPLPAKTRRTTAPQSLEQLLDQIGRRAPTRSPGVSVAVADLDTGETVYARNPDQPETIASVTKMLSSAAAIHFLGPDYKFRTTFWRRGEIREGNLMGSLLVVGGGDPNISGRFYDNDSFAVFDRWAEGLRQAGVLRVSGDLILNASAFDRLYRNPEWPPDRDTRWYQAPVSALSYNDNVVIVSVGRGALPGAPAIVSIDPDTDVVQTVPRARTVGKTGKIRVAVARPGGSDTVYVDGTVPARYFRYSVPLAIDDPPKFFGAALKSRLRAAGIELTGTVVERDVKPDNAWALVATTESDLMPTMAISNKHSQSFYAEQIFKALAFEKSGRGSWDAALALERQFLAVDRPGSGAVRPPRRVGPFGREPGRGLGPGAVSAGHERPPAWRRLAVEPGGVGRFRGVPPQPPSRLGGAREGRGQDRNPERCLDPGGLCPRKLWKDLRFRHSAERPGGDGPPGPRLPGPPGPDPAPEGVGVPRPPGGAGFGGAKNT